MTVIRNPDLLEATRLTNAGRVTEATATLQRMLRGGHPAPSMVPTSETSAARRATSTLDGAAEPLGAAEARSAPRVLPDTGTGQPPFRAATPGPALPEPLRGILDKLGHGRLQPPHGRSASPFPPAPPVPVPDSAQFLTATFSNEAGSRPYKLYVPSGYHAGQPVPLIVMLHGCTQSPDDFAAGTRMNEAAEEHTCLVAYPGQTASANMQKCWNWFNEGNQRRGQGEPSLIAGITCQVMRDYAVDPRRVYVAGLSAGGAAAAIMGHAYPDIFAAIGVHSGLACGAARDIQSAFAAMQRGGTPGIANARPGSQRRIVPAIVFHGDRDGTVSLRNADAVVAQSAHGAAFSKRTESGRTPGGHAYSRTLSTDADGRIVIEHWVVHGAGHAWFGGSTAGSYTDPRGPDATREILRFFLEHRHPASAQTP